MDPAKKRRHWYDQSDYSFWSERRYSEFGNDIIINTKGAKFEIILMTNELPRSEHEIEVESFLLVPWKDGNVAQIVNINSMGIIFK